MANKKNKKKVQQNNEAQKATASSSSKVETSKAVSKKDAAPAKKAKAKAKKNEKPGFIARTKNYFRSVKSEMKRVVWPSKKELINYSVTVCVSLIVVGVAIALLDMLIGEGLVLFSGLRG